MCCTTLFVHEATVATTQLSRAIVRIAARANVQIRNMTVQILYKAHHSPIANIRKSSAYSRRLWSFEC
jgi:hypothetical protein